MRWTEYIQLRHSMPRLNQDESGQSMIIVVLAIIALVAIIGLGVDLGMAYAERVNLSRAMDAAALAGAQELPSEEAAHQRALEYLDANGYDTGNACIETHGSSLGDGSGACTGSEAETRIIVDTLQFRSGGEENSANRINVRASQDVPLAFMRILGFDTVPIGASATAENIEDLDIVIVYDRSGSMQEDTRCYGCWEPDPTGDYPSGSTYPLPFTIVPTTGVAYHCQPSEPLNFEGYWYVSMEAEHYSRYLTEADYHREWTEFPKIWWAMERQPGTNASGPDYRGAYMKVGPHSSFAVHYKTMANIVSPPHYWTTPRLDYDFTVPQGGTYWVWMRAQGGVSWWADASSRRKVYVGLNSSPMAEGWTNAYGPYGADDACQYQLGVVGCSALPGQWSWNRVLRLDGLNAGPEYTLNFWAAGPGFSLDKIVITNDPRTDLDRYGRPLDWTYHSVSNGGPQETHGRTDWACMGTQDPRFNPIDSITGELDDVYDDAQPIRASKEAAKKFVRRLNTKLDQIGYVWYSNSASIRQELYCIKRYGSCDDFENVVDSIESTFARGSTNIADAMWDGIRVLSTGTEPSLDPSGQGLPPKAPGTPHYGRPNAAHIMVLMTDGQANQYPALPSGYGNCYSDNLWPDEVGESTDQRRARECVAWFANQARDRGVVLYTIGLGAQADNELLAHAADITGGWYYFAPTADELDEIFENLYERIFLRLTD
jgi:Flp pilus assembly protein TadG